MGPKLKMVSIVVAYDPQRAIGKNGKIPWSIREDMIEFKNLTMGNTVIMGRKTWESLPPRSQPLSCRRNIVISRTKSFKNAHTVSSLEDALKLATSNVYIIGGGQIYREALDRGLVDRVIASEIFDNYGGDVFFPELPGWTGEVTKTFSNFAVVEYIKS